MSSHPAVRAESFCWMSTAMVSILVWSSNSKVTVLTFSEEVEVTSLMCSRVDMACSMGRVISRSTFSGLAPG